MAERIRQSAAVLCHQMQEYNRAHSAADNPIVRVTDRRAGNVEQTSEFVSRVVALWKRRAFIVQDCESGELQVFHPETGNVQFIKELRFTIRFKRNRSNRDVQINRH